MEEEADDIMVKGFSKCLDKLQKIEEKIDALSKINQGLDGEKLLDNQDIRMILKIDKKTRKISANKSHPLLKTKWKNFLQDVRSHEVYEKIHIPEHTRSLSGSL